MTELDAYKPGSEVKDQSGKAVVPADGEHVTYQLFYRPEQAKFTNNARVTINLSSLVILKS